MRRIIRGGTIYTEEAILRNGWLLMENGKLVSFGQGENYPQDIELIQLPETATVLPGMIDVHIHGVAGVDVMDASIEALQTMARALAREGTTAFLATTITQSKEAISQALVNAANYIEEYQVDDGAECLGIHLEGPFVNFKRKGAQPGEYLREPDLDLMSEWVRLSRGHIRIVTLAPELKNGIALVRLLKQMGIIASIGHSDATYQECLSAIEAGASHVTHLFNGMRGLHHREIGVAGTAFLRKELMVELIADGIHVHSDMIQIAMQQVTSKRLILITDAMRAKCLKNGTYDLGGQTVYVQGQKACLEDGTLAGSILKMNDAVRNIRLYTEASFRDVIRMTAENPAKELGIFDRKGSLAVGKDADVVALDEKGEVLLTICRGKVAYQKVKNIF